MTYFKMKWQCKSYEEGNYEGGQQIVERNVYVHKLMHLFISPREHKNLLTYFTYMFRSMTIIRELVLEPS